MRGIPTIQGFSTVRARSYLLRLPLFTRALIVLVAAVWIAGFMPFWDLRQWGALIPDEINPFTCQYNAQVTRGTGFLGDEKEVAWRYYFGHAF